MKMKSRNYYIIYQTSQETWRPEHLYKGLFLFKTQNDPKETQTHEDAKRPKYDQQGSKNRQNNQNQTENVQ